MEKALIIVLVIIILSCKNEEETHIGLNEYKAITEYYASFEESNRLQFRKLVVEEHLTSNHSNFLNNGIIRLYDILDLAVESLLNKSGGYHPTKAVLVGSNKIGIGIEIFNQQNIKSKIEKELNELKNQQKEKQVYLGNEVIKEIEVCLYPILSNRWNENYLKEQPVSKLYLELMIMQNRLLVTEIKYFEALRDN